MCDLFYYYYFLGAASIPDVDRSKTRPLARNMGGMAVPDAERCDVGSDLSAVHVKQR